MPGRFPSEWLSELVRRTDAVRIVSSYTTLKKNGSKYWGLCPFHGEKTASFSVDADKKLYYCFGCKAGGNIISFVKEMEHISFYDACKYLADLEHMPLPELIEDPAYQQRRQLRDRLYECNKEAARFYHQTLFSPEGKDSLDYLRSRGVDDTVIRRFGLGASPNHWDALLQYMKGLGYSTDELRLAGLVTHKDAQEATEDAPAKPARDFDMFRNRAMYPIIDQYGHVLGFGGRILGKGEPKYLNTGDTMIFNKRLGVYAANLLKKERNLDRVILVEGYMDVIALSQFGVHGVVATLGTALTDEQAQLLHRFAPKVYLSYDGDKAGQHAILRGLDIFERQGMPARVLDFPDGLDPDEFIRRDGAKAFAQLPAISPETYRMRRLKDNYDLTTQDGKMDYARACAQLLAKADPLERESRLQDLVLQTGFTKQVLMEQLNLTAAMQAADTQKKQQTPKPLFQKPIQRNAQATDPALRAQETIVSILASGHLETDNILSEEDFTDPLLASLYHGLHLGKEPASLISELQDPQDQQRAAQLMMDIPTKDTTEQIEILRQCIRTLQITRIDQQMKNIMEQLKGASPDEKQGLLKQYQHLDLEKANLK